MHNVVSLDDLFHKRIFHIPDYQRGYSWEEQQVTEFLEDLELLAFGRYHYTGTVVLHQSASDNRPMDVDGNTYTSAAIVDGQQRITTIVVLLDSISKSLNGFSPQAKGLSQGLRKNFIETTSMTAQPLFKLSLNQDTDHYFRTGILAQHPSVEAPKITSERRLLKAKAVIARYLEDNMQAEDVSAENWLRDLYSKVTTQLRFTLYEVEDEAEVGVIFEVMNDRGRPLTDLEKVKNFLLHTSNTIGFDNELAQAANGAWAEILRQLMAAGLVSSADEDRLLRAHWLTNFDPQARQWQGSRSVKAKFDLRRHKGQCEELLATLHRYTESLRASCISFCDAYHPNRPNSFQSFASSPNKRNEVIEWSIKLARIGLIAPFLPLLLSVRERWPSDPDKYLDILRLCEIFAFRVYRLTERRSDAGQSALFRLGHDVAHRQVSFEDTTKRLKWEIAYWCGTDYFKRCMSNDHERMKSVYHWSGLRYFLYEYEIALAQAKGASPIVTWNELRKGALKDTIEHILPQSIHGQAAWEEIFHENHRRYIHDLGNLTLTKHNPHYGNKAFPDKKGGVSSESPCYATSPLYVERELTLWEEWTPSTIQDRRARLLEWALTRWALDLDELEEIERESDDRIEDDEDAENIPEESEPE